MRPLSILEFLQDCEEPPLTSESLRSLESTLGVGFPHEYARFLLQFNGGHFHRPVSFYLPEPTEFIDHITIDCFLGESQNCDTSEGLVWHAQMLAGCIPDDCLVIARCAGRDKVLLQVAGPSVDLGKMWFWDSVDEADGNNIHWIADSFNEFLSMLLLDLDESEESETIPIFQIIERGNLQSVERFVSAGGSIDTRNAEGLTLLAAAAKYAWPKIVRLLLDHSADPNARDEQGRTPLHHAAMSSFDCVKLLVAAGADVNARDDDGKGVLGGWWHRIDHFLRAHGAED